MHINEPFPEIEAGIANEAKKRDKIVSTHNCVVLGLVENGTNKPKFMRVNEPEDHDRVKAVKKTKLRQRKAGQAVREEHNVSVQEKNLSTTKTEKPNNEKQVWAQTQFFVFASNAYDWNCNAYRHIDGRDVQ